MRALVAFAAAFGAQTASATTARPCAAVALPAAADVVVQGTTAGAADHSSGASCGYSGGGHGAPDLVFEYSAPAAGRYEIRTIAASFDAYLYVRADSCAPEQRELACDPVDGGGRDAAVSLDLVAGQHIAIIVDGRRPAGGTFTLQVSRHQPDLVADTITAPAAALSGERFLVAAEASNVGDGVADDVEIRLVFAADPALTDSIKEAAACRFAHVDPGATVRCAPNVALGAPLLGSGQYYIGAIVDPDNAVVEANEDDNRVSQPLTLQYDGTISQSESLRQAVFRADDGTVYQLIFVVPPPGGLASADRYRITTIGGSTTGLGTARHRSACPAAASPRSPALFPLG